MNTVKAKAYAPIVLRVGIAVVFMWFGYHQLINQTMWISLIPHWMISLTGMSARTIVIANGVFEVLMSLLLIFGYRLRTVGILLSLHLLMIICDVGLSAIGMRDVGLMFATISIALYGADAHSVDRH
jgi:uncharacterized membrane protein YphA (DoxX/SURF4 family)